MRAGVGRRGVPAACLGATYRPYEDSKVNGGFEKLLCEDSRILG